VRVGDDDLWGMRVVLNPGIPPGGALLAGPTPGSSAAVTPGGEIVAGPRLREWLRQFRDDRVALEAEESARLAGEGERGVENPRAECRNCGHPRVAHGGGLSCSYPECGCTEFEGSA
jgi:hypothetical protein